MTPPRRASPAVSATRATTVPPEPRLIRSSLATGRKAGTLTSSSPEPRGQKKLAARESPETRDREAPSPLAATSHAGAGAAGCVSPQRTRIARMPSLSTSSCPCGSRRRLRVSRQLSPSPASSRSAATTPRPAGRTSRTRASLSWKSNRSEATVRRISPGGPAQAEALASHRPRKRAGMAGSAAGSGAAASPALATRSDRGASSETGSVQAAMRPIDKRRRA